ncbi:MAG TPA: M23 family metallopeptidase [Candidatus Binatia bacterium]|nr:M23 family metallopeptidase [Candidatus Binatia bacterium]
MPLAAVGLMVLLPASASADPGPAKIATAERWHEVRPGDSLWRIARQHGVSLAALRAANGFGADESRLRVGQRLIVPGSGAVRTGDPGRAETSGRGRLASRPGSGRTDAWRLRVPSDLVLALPDFADRAPLFSWPVEGRISSLFGLRRSGWHTGIDIRADGGTPVAAAWGGLVVSSRWEPRYGQVVKIEHRDGFTTVYAHNAENLVEVGERVFPGQLIARVGRSGRATAEHLHFEIRRGGLAYNPLFFLPLPARLGRVGAATDGSVDHE